MLSAGYSIRQLRGRVTSDSTGTREKNQDAGLFDYELDYDTGMYFMSIKSFELYHAESD